MIQVLFVVLFGAVAIWFAYKVFTTASMMRSALALLFSMTAVGAMFLALQAEFLGVLQIMMMASEMVVMALFMIMYMMNPGGLAAMEMTHQKRLSIAVAVVAGLLAVGAALFGGWPLATEAVAAPAGQTRELGLEIMERSMLVFETAGVTILVAMIATTALAIRRPA
ncbi:MAG: NADH-quinone oxidoreductase subunit J [Trueperaceae bacterium]|nr:NADH-quinone oxidoreductase subunit J [Trueperaceae bacterium]